MPRVSICIPTYCQIDFLRHTLESVYEQDFNDYEIIITDDSPDDSVQNLLTEFDFGSRLRYFKNPISLGSPENWNEAVSKANGELIKVLHHDDMFAHPRALREFVRLMDESPNADIGFCSSMVVDFLTNVSRLHSLNDKQLQMLSCVPEFLFLGNLIGAPSATIYRRNLTNLHYDKRLKWLVDIDFYIRALQKNSRFAYTFEALISTPTNASHQVTEVCKDNSEIVMIEHLILYEKHSAQLATYPSVINYWLSIFGQYGIYTVADIKDINNFSESQKKIISELLAVFHKRPILKLVYFLYWQLEAPPFIRLSVRAFIRISYNFFSYLRDFYKYFKHQTY